MWYISIEGHDHEVQIHNREEYDSLEKAKASLTEKTQHAQENGLVCTPEGDDAIIVTGDYTRYMLRIYTLNRQFETSQDVSIKTYVYDELRCLHVQRDQKTNMISIYLYNREHPDMLIDLADMDGTQGMSDRVAINLLAPELDTLIQNAEETFI